MSDFTAMGSRWAPQAQGLLRIVTALMFIQHGTAKLLGVPHVDAMAGVQLMSLFGLAGVIEIAGGVLLLIGLFTRPVAFVLSGEMAAAYFMGHAPHGALPLLNGGELAVQWCFVFLFFWASGPGAFSVDGSRKR